MEDARTRSGLRPAYVEAHFARFSGRCIRSTISLKKIEIMGSRQPEIRKQRFAEAFLAPDDAAIALRPSAIISSHDLSGAL